VAYLRRRLGDVRTPGDLARTILALRGAGVDPSRFGGEDLVAKLAGRRRPDGSYQGWPNSTAFAVMALRAGDGGGGFARSLAWLRRAQGRDGGWGAVPGAASDPDSTGAVLQALGPGSRAARRGVRFLRRSQQGNGGWPLVVDGTSNSQSTAWAIQGLLAAGVPPASVKQRGRSGLDYLAAQRLANGHYRYSSSSDQTPVWVTGQVLVAAQGKTYPLAPVPSAAPPAAPAHQAGTGAPQSGKAGGEAHPSLSHHSRGKRSGSSESRKARSGAKRSGGATPPPTTTTADTLSGSPRNTSAQVPAAATPNGDQGGGSSPLIPIAIALAAAGVVAGGTWWAARRFVW
jgi:Prenyltransferase and squalene oxidase repeat